MVPLMLYVTLEEAKKFWPCAKKSVSWQVRGNGASGGQKSPAPSGCPNS